MAHWPRRQFLVLSMDAMLANQRTVLGQIYHFLGRREGSTLLPHANSHNSPTKVRQIPCDVKRRLQQFFAPWNALLHTSVTPELPPFQSRVPCTQE